MNLRSPIFLNHKPLKKLLKLWGLVALRRVKGKKKSGIEKILEFLGEKVNLVKRLKKEVDLFELFFTDFTRLVYQNGKRALWFCSYLAARTKGVLGFSLSPNPDTKTALEGYRKIKEFIKRERGEMEKVMIHQDQGSPFRSYEYVGELIKDGVTLSYCRKGKFEDNPEMESFFGRFKDEWKKVIFKAQTEKGVRFLVKKAVKYYNQGRIHSNHGCSPFEFLKRILKTKS